MKTKIKNKVLKDLAHLIEKNSKGIISANQTNLTNCTSKDEALYDRLKVDELKINGMINSINKVMQMSDPEGITLYSYQKEKDQKVEIVLYPLEPF